MWAVIEEDHVNFGSPHVHTFTQHTDIYTLTHSYTLTHTSYTHSRAVVFRDKQIIYGCKWVQILTVLSWMNLPMFYLEFNFEFLLFFFSHIHTLDLQKSWKDTSVLSSLLRCQSSDQIFYRLYLNLGFLDQAELTYLLKWEHSCLPNLADGGTLQYLCQMPELILARPCICCMCMGLCVQYICW